MALAPLLPVPPEVLEAVAEKCMRLSASLAQANSRDPERLSRRNRSRRRADHAALQLSILLQWLTAAEDSDGSLTAKVEDDRS